jgi:hypothetical protein
MNERTATPGQAEPDYTADEIDQALSWLDERDGVLA